MTENDELLKRAFELLKKEGKPTEQQKKMMLYNILMESQTENVSTVGKIKKLVVAYPWRFAFIASAVQAVVFTMIFGTQYTNMFLNFFGG